MQRLAPQFKVPLIAKVLPDAQILTKLLTNRKSHRNFKKEPLSIEQISNLLWATQGILPDGRRTAPSAGAIYPFKVLVSLALPPAKLNQGLYLFLPTEFELHLLFKGNFQKKLFEEALFQECIINAPMCIILAANIRQIQRVYQERAINYIFLEGGHIGQNLYLMATALNLGTVAVGAFHDEGVRRVVLLNDDELPIYLFPVGIPKD